MCKRRKDLWERGRLKPSQLDCDQCWFLSFSLRCAKGNVEACLCLGKIKQYFIDCEVPHLGRASEPCGTVCWLWIIRKAAAVWYQPVGTRSLMLTEHMYFLCVLSHWQELGRFWPEYGICQVLTWLLTCDSVWMQQEKMLHIFSSTNWMEDLDLMKSQSVFVFFETHYLERYHILIYIHQYYYGLW